MALFSLVCITITTLASFGITLQQVKAGAGYWIDVGFSMVSVLKRVPQHKIVYGVGVYLYILPAVHPGVWCKTLQKDEGLSFTPVKAWNLLRVNLTYCVEKKGPHVQSCPVDTPSRQEYVNIFRVGPKGVKTLLFPLYTQDSCKIASCHSSSSLTAVS